MNHQLYITQLLRWKYFLVSCSYFSSKQNIFGLWTVGIKEDFSGCIFSFWKQLQLLQFSDIDQVSYSLTPPPLGTTAYYWTLHLCNGIWKNLKCIQNLSYVVLHSAYIALVFARPECLTGRPVPLPLPAACAGLCYWLIESVFCAAALPWRLVLAHTHCSRTNENTPRHLPKRDTPLPSPCPPTFVPSLFLLFSSNFYSFLHAPTLSPFSPSHSSLLSPLFPLHFLFYLLTLTVLILLSLSL